MDQEALLNYAREAADFSTNQQLPSLDFAINHYGQPDVAMFDFTCMYASENAALVREQNGHQLLVALVGDSLLEVCAHLPGHELQAVHPSLRYVRWQDGCWLLQDQGGGSEGGWECWESRIFSMVMISQENVCRAFSEVLSVPSASCWDELTLYRTLCRPANN